MEIGDKEFKKKFNSKKRLDCAGCGGTRFAVLPTGIPSTDVSEAIFLKCKNCGHTRLELM